MKKVLAIASAGGHYVQLSRIVSRVSRLGHVTVVFATTKVADIGVVNNAQYVVDDLSRDEISKLPKVMTQAFKIVRCERPDAVISTGALPGLVFMVIGKILGIKTVWVDSIANSQRLSLSGRIACRFVDVALTQWPHLANGRIKYQGGVI